MEIPACSLPPPPGEDLFGESSQTSLAGLPYLSGRAPLESVLTPNGSCILYVYYFLLLWVVVDDSKKG